MCQLILFNCYHKFYLLKLKKQFILHAKIITMPNKIKMLVDQFKPSSYVIDIKISADKKNFSGQIIIEGKKIGPPSKRITFHQRNLSVFDAEIYKINKNIKTKLNLDRLVHHQKLNEVRLHFKDLIYPSDFEIKLKFKGKIINQLNGIYPCFYKDQDQNIQKIISTQFESYYARQAFPCIDEPAAKASFKLSIETNKQDTVLSNTPLEQIEEKKSTNQFFFEKTPLMSTYLLAFVVGQLSHKSIDYRDRVKISVYTTPDKINLADYSLEIAQKGLEFFEHYFKIDYPLKKLDLVALPDFSAGAMENWGLITFRETYMLTNLKEDNIDQMQSVSLTICHELAHQWFGNLVTMKWWNDLWLNESFANLMEFIAIDNLFPDWKIMEQFINYTMSAAKSRDSLKEVQTLRANIKYPADIETIFDASIVYAKGGSILYMLMQYIGEENFKIALNNYFKQYAYQNTVADNLWQTMSSASQQNIASFMDNWLNQPGFPLLKVNYEPKEKRFLIEQKRFLLKLSHHTDELNETIWQIPLASNYKLKNNVLNKKQKSFYIDEPLMDNKPLILNHNSTAYFIPQYLNKSHWQTILNNIENLSKIDQINLIDNYNLLQKNLFTDLLTTESLLSHYKNNPNDSIWVNIASILSQIRRLIIDDQILRDNLDKLVGNFIQDIFNSINLEIQSNESSLQIKLRKTIFSLAASYNYSPLIDYAESLFKNFKKPDDINSNIRTIIYRIAVKKADNFDLLLKLHNQLTNQELRDEIIYGLSTTKELSQIKKLLDMILSTKIKDQDIVTIFSDLINNHHAQQLTWEWYQAHFNDLQKIYTTDATTLSHFPAIIASYFNTKKMLEEYQEFFKPKLDDQALRRNILLGLDQIKKQIEWYDFNQPKIKTWLKQAKQL